MADASARTPSIVTGVASPVLAAALAAALALASPARAESPLAAEHRRLMELVQGGTVMVAASPALCSAAGRPMLGPRPGVRDWYFRSGACMLPFATDYLGIVTRGTQGLDRDLRDVGRVAALRDAIAAIRARLSEASSQERLILHSTAWELAPAIEAQLDDAAGALSQALGALRCEVLGLLRETAHTREQAAALPSTLELLPTLADTEEIADLARRIASRDEEIVELLPPPEAHARLLHGRFTLRVFFTGSTPAARRQVREYLLSTPYDDAGKLPLEVTDVVSVLVLYFNVLDPELRILPTEQVAFWQQYSFEGRLVLERDELEQAEERVRFLSIRYQRNYEGDAPLYARLDETAMSRTGFVDGMPSAMSAPVTTLRGACLRCHRRVISSFHPEEKREVRFTTPLAVSGRDLLTPSYLESTEALFQRWAASCAP